MKLVNDFDVCRSADAVLSAQLASLRVQGCGVCRVQELMLGPGVTGGAPTKVMAVAGSDGLLEGQLLLANPVIVTNPRGPSPPAARCSCAGLLRGRSGCLMVRGKTTKKARAELKQLGVSKKTSSRD